MPRVGMHHVDIVVSSLDRSLPLYRELLEPLGYVYAAEFRGERGETIWYLDGDGVGVSLGIREAQSLGGARPVRSRPPPPRLRGVLARGRRRAVPLGRRPRPRDRERAAGMAVHPRLLRHVLPRPRRDQARGRPRALISGLPSRRRRRVLLPYRGGERSPRPARLPRARSVLCRRGAYTSTHRSGSRRDATLEGPEFW